LDHAGSNGEEMTQIDLIVSEHQQCPIIVSWGIPGQIDKGVTPYNSDFDKSSL